MCLETIDDDTPVSQDNVHLLLPYLLEWIAQYVMECRHVGRLEALRAIYSSRMYARLEVEATDLWMWGPVALYELLCDEKGWLRPEKRVVHWEPGADGDEKGWPLIPNP